MSWLNGWLPECCTEFDAYSISPLAEDETSIHGQLGCHGPKPATLVNIKRFKEVFGVNPRYNFFNNKNPTKVIPINTKKENSYKANNEDSALPSLDECIFW